MPDFQFSTYEKFIKSSPGLKELKKDYPELWEEVNTDLIEKIGSGKTDGLYNYIRNIKSITEHLNGRIQQSGSNHKVVENAFPQLIKAKMSALALDQYYLAAMANQFSGKVKFNTFNGLLLQKLLFKQALERKPVSWFWFKFFWPLITQKRILMPLVNKKGIYCFYTDRLIAEIMKIIGSSKTLEIGAGDGTLTRFLKDRGAEITAADDYSWDTFIKYPVDVEFMGAKQALEKYQPGCVICSWPPPWNNFEKHVFQTKSVKIYIVIGSTNESASGNHETYLSQKEFEYKNELRLSKLVVPPELNNAVYIFRRIKS